MPAIQAVNMAQHRRFGLALANKVAAVVLIISLGLLGDGVRASNATSSGTVVNIAGSCGIRGSLFDDDGRIQYDILNSNDVWTRVVSLSPDFLLEKSSSNADIGKALNPAYAHSFAFKEATHEKWAVSSVQDIAATSLNDGREAFQQRDSNLRLLAVTLTKSFVLDSKLGTRIARVSMDHYMFLNRGMWVDQTHGHRTRVHCGAFVFTWRVENWPFCNKTVNGQDQCDGTGCKLQVVLGIRDAQNLVLRHTNAAHMQKFRFGSPANRNNMFVMNRVYTEASSDGPWVARGLHDPECPCENNQCPLKEIKPFAGGACAGLRRGEIKLPFQMPSLR
jgi:hypothetical protein